MKGYYKNPSATNEVLRLHRDGRYWIHTDDLGYMDNDGFIYHCGRAKRMLTRSGNKVWLANIESEVSELECIRECCAVKMDDVHEREVPVLHLVLNSNAPCETTIIAMIEQKIRQACSEHSIPKFYVIRDSIPYTETNKKMDYRKLETENIYDTKQYQNKGNLFIKLS